MLVHFMPKIIRTLLKVYPWKRSVKVKCELKYITWARLSISSQRETWSTGATVRALCVVASLSAASIVFAAFVYFLEINKISSLDLSTIAAIERTCTYC